MCVIYGEKTTSVLSLLIHYSQGRCRGRKRGEKRLQWQGVDSGRTLLRVPVTAFSSQVIDLLRRKCSLIGVMTAEIRTHSDCELEPANCQTDARVVRVQR